VVPKPALPLHLQIRKEELLPLLPQELRVLAYAMVSGNRFVGRHFPFALPPGMASTFEPARITGLHRLFLTTPTSKIMARVLEPGRREQGPTDRVPDPGALVRWARRCHKVLMQPMGRKGPLEFRLAGRNEDAGAGQSQAAEAAGEAGQSQAPIPPPSASDDAAMQNAEEATEDGSNGPFSGAAPPSTSAAVGDDNTQSGGSASAQPLLPRPFPMPTIQHLMRIAHGSSLSTTYPMEMPQVGAPWSFLGLRRFRGVIYQPRSDPNYPWTVGSRLSPLFSYRCSCFPCSSAISLLVIGFLLN
jgi:hypothetical protein